MNGSNLVSAAGIVTEIERYSIHDGPGVRTVVFLKGCQLHCSWCCNPETINPVIEMGYFEHLCTHCHNCIQDCPFGAISILQDSQLITKRSICYENCYGRVDEFPCTIHCYAEARKSIGEQKTVAEILEVVEKDRNYYLRTGGGVTLTGGEISMQPQFASALIQAIKQNWIDVAIETNGFGDFAFYEQISPFLSFAFFDIKTLDPLKHISFTGGSVEKIKSFARRFSALSKKNEIEVVVRVPLVPGFNDDSDQLTQIAKFVAEELPDINKIELLPFHKLGLNKYRSIGKEYDFENFQTIDLEKVEKFSHVFANFGIQTVSF